MQHLAILPIVIPLLTATLLLLPAFKANLRLRRVFSGVGLALLVLASLFAFAHTSSGAIDRYLVGNWQEPYGILLVLDRVSALFVTLTAVLSSCVWLYSIKGDDEKGAYFQPLFHFQLMGINGAFLTGDLFNLFVFFEVLLISSYGLLMHGGGKARTKAAIHYVLLNLFGSAVFLLALGLLYGVLGSLNISDMAQRISQLDPSQQFLVKSAAGMLLLVFGLKAAILPLQFWLSATYSAALPVVAALFAIMTKVGFYSIVRVFSVFFATAEQPLVDYGMQMMSVFGLITILLASIGVLGSPDLRKLSAYLVLLSVGSLFVVFASGSPQALGAALFYAIHSTLLAAAMFLLVDLIAQQRGTVGERLVQGRPVTQPVLLGTLFFICAAAIAGLPPFSGAIAKLWLLQSVVAGAWHGWIWAFILLSSLMVLIALSRAGSTLFWRVNKQSHAGVMASKRRLAAVYLLLGCSPLLVVFGEHLMQFCLQAAMQLLPVSHS
ncbi:MAG: monovalent cation/H+ antiporter subunit D [Rheinheimera sp.]